MVPLYLALHERHTFSFDSSGNQSQWPGRPPQTQILQRIKQFNKRMTIYFSHIPVECPPFVCQRVKPVTILSKICSTLPVSVNNSDKIIQFVMSGEHSCFPYRPLITLTVSK